MTYEEESISVSQQMVLEDLINAMLAEKLLEDHPSVKLLSSEEWRRRSHDDMRLAAIADELGELDDHVSVVIFVESTSEIAAGFLVKPALNHPYRLTGDNGAVKAWIGEGSQVMHTQLGPLEFMKLIAALYAHDPITIDQESLTRFMDMLDQTVQHTAWSLENARPETPVLSLLGSMSSLLAAERKAAFRDRPFHPVSKVKQGWGYEECRQYTAEFANPIKLSWMAVKREYLASGQEQSDDCLYVTPEKLLLSEEQRCRLAEVMVRRGLDAEAYVPIPVHPWQMQEVLPEKLQQEMESGICVPLQVELGEYYATSSVRSLMPESGGTCHVKLPLGMYSLGGLRYLSAIKLMNGQCAERLLRNATALDERLREQLFLCDETFWWAYLPEDRDLFADYPRHVSVMVRQYPAALIEDEDVRLFPMSTLAVASADRQGHVFDEWLAFLGAEYSEANIRLLFREVFIPYFELIFRLFKLGIMPEIHGQNCVLVWRRGKIEGLLLRDHDAVRLYVPWLNANGLEDPAYRLRPGYPNSLYHDHPEKLLAFFQMLGIQVNGCAVLTCVAKHYGIPEEVLWTELESCLEQAIVQAELPQEVERVLRSSLFEQAMWPWKQVVRPLIKQHLRVPGSMPFGQGEVPNPLHVLKTMKEKQKVEQTHASIGG
ncbi:IucA/IucC family protein [Paenibacillus hexagrammi]|uniref:IucA/IucC family protein n=1 Tax=Paenibacillus hexagrammi TaxID=2908839 RepID=A0ABY3SQ02_9BACL|nr:IucA/IucC family protein [Paenibacillus sp. YPD9-1]UJF36078.1 IucA/IucC family protein [Paenibacillus sp. YPD9-1]